MDLKKEVCFVRNFVDANGIYLSCTEFKEKYGIDTNFLTYNGCIQEDMYAGLVL